MTVSPRLTQLLNHAVRLRSPQRHIKIGGVPGIATLEGPEWVALPAEAFDELQALLPHLGAQEGPRPIGIPDVIAVQQIGASPPAVSGPTEAFEHLASAFYEDTGFFAPGKSVPLEMGSERYEDERRAAWEIWNAGRKRVSAVAEGPWRVEDTGDAAPWWMVVSGQGKPPCSSCGREWSGFTRTAFGSAVQLEATAVCDALNRVAAQATQEETHE